MCRCVLACTNLKHLVHHWDVKCFIGEKLTGRKKTLYKVFSLWMPWLGNGAFTWIWKVSSKDFVVIFGPPRSFLPWYLHMLSPCWCWNRKIRIGHISAIATDALTPYVARALSYYSDLTVSQEFRPMAAQLSMKAALPSAKILATASCRCSKTGPRAQVWYWQGGINGTCLPRGRISTNVSSQCWELIKAQVYFYVF